MAKFTVPAEKGKLKSKLKSLYRQQSDTIKDGTTIYEAKPTYMDVLHDSGDVLLKNYEYKWYDYNTIIIDGKEEGKCIITSRSVENLKKEMNIE